MLLLDGGNIINHLITPNYSELEQSSYECNVQFPNERYDNLLLRSESTHQNSKLKLPTCAVYYSVNSPQLALCEI